MEKKLIPNKLDPWVSVGFTTKSLNVVSDQGSSYFPNSATQCHDRDLNAIRARESETTLRPRSRYACLFYSIPTYLGRHMLTDLEIGGRFDTIGK